MTANRQREARRRVRAFALGTFMLMLTFLASLGSGGRVTDCVIARLNEDVILASDLRELLREKGVDATGDPVGIASREHLRALYDRTLLLQAAKKMTVAVPEADILDQVEGMVAQVRSQYPSESDFRADVVAQHGSVEAFKRELEKKATLDYKIARAIHARFTITDADVARYEEECRAKGKIPASYRLRRLGVPIENDSEESRKSALAEVQRILEDGTARGLGFAQIVQHYTKVPDERATAGDLGFIGAEQLAPEVRRAVEKLQPGQVSKPIVAGNFASIFYMEAKRGPRATLYEQRFLETREKLLGELRKKARLQLFDARLLRKVPKEYTSCVEPTALAGSTANTARAAGNSSSILSTSGSAEASIKSSPAPASKSLLSKWLGRSD